VKVKIDVDTKTFVRLLLVVSGFMAVVFLAWKLLPVLLILAVSFFLAIALNKPVSSLARRLPGHSRVLATALSYIVFVVVLGLFFSLVVPVLINQTVTFINSLPGYIQQLSGSHGVVSDIINRYHLQREVDAFVSGMQQQVGVYAQGIGSNLVAGLSTLVTGFVAVVTVLVMTFLMLIEGPRWQEQLWQTYSDQRLLQHHQELIHRMYRVVTGYVNGQVLVAAIAGCLASCVIFVLSFFFPIPTAAILPLGVVAFLASLVPLVGPTIGAAIILTVLVFNGVGAALIYLVYFIIYAQIEANIVQPTIQSRTVEMSALTIIVAVIAGIVLFGLLGGILAIPIAGCIRVLALDFIDERQKERMRHHKLPRTT